MSAPVPAPSLDRVVAFTATSVPISTTAASGNLVVYGTGSSPALPAGKVFIVFHLFLESSAAVDIKIISGATDITGAIPFTAARAVEWRNGTFPVFRGGAVDEDFIINAGGSTNLRGWALVGASDR